MLTEEYLDSKIST